MKTPPPRRNETASPILHPTALILTLAGICLAAASHAGTIRRLIYEGIPGTRVEDLTSAPGYPDAPTRVEMVEGLLQGQSDIGDYYGSLMEGYLEAPQSGFYTFWVHSDDFGELWLSTNASPAGLVRVARVGVWSYPNEWDKYLVQKSEPIPLVGGEKYLMRVLQKENWGGDNVGVGWQRPDGVLERPMPTLYIQPYQANATALSIARQPAGATTTENQPVSFSVDLNPLNRPVSFQWYLDAVPIPGAVLSSVTFKPVLADDGKEVWARIDDSLESARASLSVTPDPVRPRMLAVDPLGYDRLLEVEFSKPMAAQAATNPANYGLDGGSVEVLSAELLPGGEVVRLRTEPFAWESNHLLAVANLTDTAASPNLLLGDSLGFLASGVRPKALAIQTQPQDATVVTYRDVSFAAQVTGQPGPTSVQWFRDGEPLPPSPDPGGGLVLELPRVSSMDDGATFQAVISNLVDVVVTQVAHLTVLADNEPPVLVSAAGSDHMDEVLLTFFERVDSSSGADPGSYTIPGLTVQSATVHPNETQVVLETSRQDPGTVYQVRVDGVRDLSGNPVPSSEAAFASWKFSPGLAQIEWYFLGLSWTLDQFIEHASNTPPTRVTVAAALETPTWDNGEYYGARVQGVLIPPQTGAYVFHIWSDDYSQFQLSSDWSFKNLPAEPQCWVPGWTEPYVWNGYPSQTSAPIHLIAGQQYYFRLHQIEWFGGDGFSVAWDRPDGTFEVIPSQYLGRYTEPVNSPPVLQSLPDRLAPVEKRLRFRCPASDPDAPGQELAFSLETGAPERARVDSADGWFTWTPRFEDAGGQYDVEVRVSDNGFPPFGASQTFRIVVPDVAFLSFDDAVGESGSSPCVPVSLRSSTGLRTLEFAIRGLGHWGDLTLNVPPEVGSVTSVTPTVDGTRFQVRSADGAGFDGDRALGTLCFTIPAAEASGFQWIAVTGFGAVGTDAVALADCRTGSLRIGVVGSEPFLELTRGSGGQPELLLYGKLGEHYLIQSTPELRIEGPWGEAWEGVLTNANLRQVVQPLETSADAQFFRAVLQP